MKIIQPAITSLILGLAAAAFVLLVMRFKEILYPHATNTTIGVLNISEEIGECTDGDTIAVSINNDEMHIRFYTTPMKLSSNEKLYIVDRY